MYGKKPLAVPAETIYIYDGSLAGFYCCVYESVYGKELPLQISPEETAEPTLFKEKWIATDPERAVRVRNSIPKKVSARALELIENVFLSCLPNKETALLKFLLLAYEEGSKIIYMLGHETVTPILKAERRMLHEAHLLTGFIRFSDHDGALIAEITPENFVLPHLVAHFTDRFYQENFMIYDKTHKAALIYQHGKAEIMPVEALEQLAVSETEEMYRELWKKFYNTIGIKERYNPKLRMSNMSKRYWQNMTEMKELL